MTPEQREAWFRYHAPTPETAPKYAAIREAERAAAAAFEAAWSGAMDLAAYGQVNAACAAFADAIVGHAPRCADATAAIRCVRLARNAANENLAVMIASGGSGFDKQLERLALDELIKARWQANAAIACGGI